MANQEILKRITQNNVYAKELIQFIEQEIPLLHKAAITKKGEMFAAEVLEKNKKLKTELEYRKKRVIELEVMNGIEQVPLHGENVTSNSIVNSKEIKQEKGDISNFSDNASKEESSAFQQSEKQSKKYTVKEKKEKVQKSVKSDKQAPLEENKEINVSRLDLRIGRITSAKKHPDAESLYVEEIDLGEDKPRTVVSGLVKFVPLEEMQNRLVVVLCNLKPAKMRGITSEAMVMCASTPEKVEILCPPPDSVPGDRVICDEYPGEPEALLPPKKKIFEQVAPDLKTNNECVATFKLAPLKVAGKGQIKSVTLKDVQIK